MPTTDMMIEALLHLRDAEGAVRVDKFWQLVERFRADLVNQAFAILGNPQDAEDVSQDTLCKAFLELHTLRDVKKLGIWLRTINRCQALSVRRRRMRTKEERLSTGQYNTLEGAPAEQEPVKGTTSGDAVVRAVDALPEPFRQVVVLRYWEKLSTAEIAQRLDLPSGTVRSRLTRADNLLALKLKTFSRKEAGLS